MYNAELGKLKYSEYKNNKPFEHIVLHNLFDNNRLKEIVDEFPEMEKEMYNKNRKNSTTVNKLAFRTPDKINLLSPKTQAFCRELNQKPFIEFLEGLTGIKDLVADDTFEGGGPHCIGKGGLLGMHIDFNIHPKLRLERRLNVLVYLNENWNDEWGGQLELWDDVQKGSKQKSISPQMNTTVVFSTTEDSWHGHPDPLQCPENVLRRSLAFYYYTNTRVETAEEHTTVYVPREGKDKFKYRGKKK